MVGVQGFEPRQAESESAVLPLDDTPVGHDTRARIMGRGPCGQGLVETGCWRGSLIMDLSGEVD